MATSRHRQEHEAPLAIAEWGWRFHHLGIPTNKELDKESYLPGLGLYVSGFTESPFGVEWMRFEPGSKIHPLIKTVPHLAFEVADLDFELNHRGLQLLGPPSEPAPGIRVAMIEYQGAPIELIQFSKSELG